MVIADVRRTRWTCYRLVYSFVWCTSGREGVLSTPGVREIIEGTLRDLGDRHGLVIISMDILDSSVISLVVSAPPRMSPSDIVNIVKGTTAKRIIEGVPELRGRRSLWCRNYFVTTVGNVLTESEVLGDVLGLLGVDLLRTQGEGGKEIS